jgi:hypothetical protein
MKRTPVGSVKLWEGFGGRGVIYVPCIPGGGYHGEPPTNGKTPAVLERWTNRLILSLKAGEKVSLSSFSKKSATKSEIIAGAGF